jgi:hypothetical protein
MTKAWILSSIAACFIVACAAEDGSSLNGGPGSGDPNGDPNNPNGDPNNPNGENGTGTVPGSTPPTADQCKGQPHVGFANFDFVSDRKAGDIGINRRRVKPYTALRTEFTRTLGKIPTNMAQSEAAYGEQPARWFVEPAAGAVASYTTYQLAFATCYETMTQAQYTTNPDATTASAECAAMQRKFWQRTATPEETKACADFTLGLTTEPLARRRWAHACASILSATGFTTY